MHCHHSHPQYRWCALLLAAVLPTAALRADQPAAAEALWKKLEPFAQPPEEFADKFGPYRSPLKFDDGSIVKTSADWAKRRAEIEKTWQKRLGPWPPLVERPTVKKLESAERDGYTEHKVRIQIAADGKTVDGYLLVPKAAGPVPAVLVPFYEPLTSIGRGTNGKGVGTHDYGLQLVKRGMVTLSIGTPGALDKLGGDTRATLTKAGEEMRQQPLTLLAYVAANCRTALAQMPEVDAKRIGIIGLSYGGKWSMFASCLEERFACAVWSDPGIVFNEKDSNVNYWEPWYLGYDPKVQRKPGVPSDSNPRTGLYKEMVDAGEDLVDLHALMAPRPVLVSGGVQDPPRNWQALNHLVAVNTLLGYKQRAFLTARKTHVPTAEALELELTFLEYFLKHAPRDNPAKVESPLAEKWDYTAAMKKVAARFKGKEGVVIHVGASDTIANPYTTWARQGKGKTAEDEAVLQWIHTNANDETDGWWLCRKEVVSHRAYTAESGLQSSWLFKGGARGLPPLRKMLDDYQPQIVVLEVGIYEAEEEQPMDEYRKNMAKALDLILERGVIAIPTTAPPIQAHRKASAAYNEALRELARERGLPLIDIEQEILQRRPDDWYGTLMTRMHLTASRAGVSPASEPTAENLRESGFLLRGWVTVRKIAEVKRRVLDPGEKR